MLTALKWKNGLVACRLIQCQNILPNTNIGSNANTVINKEKIMGLDMYAYVATREGQQREYYDGAEWDEITKDLVNAKVNKPREIAYWRKHPNLHGWMEQLWRNKKYSVQPTDASAPVESDSDMFNGVEMELTAEDLDELERAVTHSQLPATSGFFFGNDKDQLYHDQDLAFIKAARIEMFMGLKVFYNSSW